MSEDDIKKHFPLPKTTKAFICANCGAVSLDQNALCRPQGRGVKADWCGLEQSTPSFCINKVNNLRYHCMDCKQVSINPELLCNPTKMENPE